MEEGKIARRVNWWKFVKWAIFPQLLAMVVVVGIFELANTKGANINDTIQFIIVAALFVTVAFNVSKAFWDIEDSFSLVALVVGGVIITIIFIVICEVCRAIGLVDVTGMFILFAILLIPTTNLYFVLKSTINGEVTKLQWLVNLVISVAVVIGSIKIIL